MVPSKCPTLTKPFIYLFTLTWIALWNWIGGRGLVRIYPTTSYLTLYPRIKFWTPEYLVEKKFQMITTFTHTKKFLTRVETYFSVNIIFILTAKNK